MRLGSRRFCGNNWNELELNPPRELNPSNGVLAKGIDHPLQLFPLGEVQVGPLPYLRVLTVAEISSSESKVVKGACHCRRFACISLMVVAQSSSAWRSRCGWHPVDSWVWARSGLTVGNPSSGVLAKGINNLLELFPLGQVQIGPLPCLRDLTVAEIDFLASKVF